MENESFIKGLLGSFDLVENNVAFSLYNGERVTDITYRQFSSDILRAAGYFCDRKINGQHVAIAAVNSYDWIVTFFAILASGNVAIPLNQDLPIDILQWECEKAEVVLICCDTSSIITCLSSGSLLPNSHPQLDARKRTQRCEGVPSRASDAACPRFQKTICIEP